MSFHGRRSHPINRSNPGSAAAGSAAAIEADIIRHAAHLSYPEEKAQLLAVLPDGLLLALSPASRRNLAQALRGELNMEERRLFHGQYVKSDRPGLSWTFSSLTSEHG